MLLCCDFRAEANTVADETNPDDAQLLAHLESKGAAHVRVLLSSGGWPTTQYPTIIKWLAEQDQEERRRSEASQREQAEIARSAKKAAWIAAIAAIVAAIVAIIAVVITWLAWLWPQ
jgi:hypothetical protein